MISDNDNFSKIFEPDLCPLPFDSNQIYEFITERLIMGDENDIANALEWLHVIMAFLLISKIFNKFFFFYKFLKFFQYKSFLYYKYKS